MQCLYCEAPLKNFRGLFDEDFCSREHREKYLASFRKALGQLPDAQTPVAPEPLFPQATLPAATSQETVQNVVREAPRAPQVQTVTVSYLPAETTTEAPQPSLAAAAQADPAVADFVQMPFAAALASASPCSIPNSAFAVWNMLSIPGTQGAWSTALEPESGMADFVEAVQAPSAATPWADTFPFHISQTRFSPADADQPGTISLDPAEVAFDETQPTAEEVTTRQQLALVTSAAIKPLVPFFSVAAETKSLPIGDGIDPALYALQLVSSPMCAAELPLAHEGFLPAFVPSRDSMSGDEQPPAVVLTAGPVNSTFSSPARSPEMMQPTFGIASAPRAAPPAQFNAPGLSLNASPQPGTMADISMPRQQAANPAAQPHTTHEPLRPTFGSSVRIKNWRLRINFAKPA